MALVRDERYSIDSPFLGKIELLAEDVSAVELSMSQHVTMKGFSDEGWQKLGTNVKDDGERLEFHSQNRVVQHWSAMDGDTLRFDLDWDSAYHLLRIQPYVDRKSWSQAFGLQLQMNGNFISVERYAINGQEQLFGIGNRNADAVDCRARSATVGIVQRGGKLHVTINDKLVKSFDFPGTATANKGLVMTGTVMAVRRSGETASIPGFRISNFQIKDLSGESIRQFLLDEAKEATLTIPRFRRTDPPTHVLVSRTGDMLRGRLITAGPEWVEFESRLETFRFPRERIASIVCLPDPTATADDPSKDAKPPQDGQTRDGKPSQSASEVEPTPRENDPQQRDRQPLDPQFVQAVLANQFVITMKPIRVDANELVGATRDATTCRIPVSAIREICLGESVDAQRAFAYSDWRPRFAPEPAWEEANQDDSSRGDAEALIGKKAEGFELPMIDGTTFRLSDHADKVIVLDFWASWCGPCIAALPQYIEATSKFDEKEVLFVAVNLEETSQQVREFLKQQDISPKVALDGDSAIAKQFGVSGIPHSVILGPGNIVRHVKVGYSQTAGEEFGKIISDILAE
ncbi:MAG: TlpA disulfide reductase family protein [Pirellulaceae bacterium]